MTTGNYTDQNNASIRTLIETSLIQFKEVSRQTRAKRYNGHKLSILSIYVLLCLRSGRSLLRHDLMKRLHVNYYDAGDALDPLILSGLVIAEKCHQRNNLNKRRAVALIRYRITLSGELFINDFLDKILEAAE